MNGKNSHSIVNAHSAPKPLTFLPPRWFQPRFSRSGLLRRQPFCLGVRQVVAPLLAMSFDIDNN